ncbi:MAG: DUF5681 domain-containing protein [Janthinobacterium lividum]
MAWYIWRVSADPTASEQPQRVVGRPFAPGQSGNPAGRPKGSRSRLAEDFFKALAEDFAVHGVAAISSMRDEKPDEYAKMIAKLMPKEIEHSGEIETTNKEQRDAAVAAASRADS